MQQAGGPGGHVPPHFLADQLTLSQPGGGTLSPPSTMCPPRFLTLAACLDDVILEGSLSVLCVCLGISAILMGLLNAKMHFRHKLGLIHHPRNQEENYLCKSESCL